MRRYTPLTTLICAGIALGAGLAWTVPTEMRPARNSELEELSKARIATYPGEDQVITGPNSYPVTYSPQWIAVAEKAERDRLAKWNLPDPGPALSYDQPSPERDLAVERQGVGEPQPADETDAVDQPLDSAPTT